MLLSRALLIAVVAAFASNYKTLLHVAELHLPYPAESEVVEALPKDYENIPHSALTGRFAPTVDLMLTVRRLYGVKGCETVVPEPDGSMTLIDAWNNVWHAREQDSAAASPAAAEPNTLGNWEVYKHPRIKHLGVGKALGAMNDHDGNLVFADAVKGLCRVDYGKTPVRLEVLASQLASDVAAAHQIPHQIAYADDVDIHPNGTIFFSDASTIAPLKTDPSGSIDVEGGSLLEVVRGTPSGRLLAYHPATGTTTVLATGIWFANGVALSPDGSYLLVSETFGLRILRYWLTGPKAGTTDVFIDGLPGYPDGVSRAADGGFWVSLVLPYLDLQAQFKHRPLRWLMAWLPKALKPMPKKWGVVVRVLESGEVAEVLADAEGRVVSGVTSTVEVGGKLWLGNLHNDYVGVVDLAEARGKAAS